MPVRAHRIPPQEPEHHRGTHRRDGPCSRLASEGKRRSGGGDGSPRVLNRRARGLQAGLAAQSRGLFGGRKEFAGRRAERLQDPRGVRAGGEGREDRPLEDIRQPVRRGGAEKDQVSSTEVEAVLSLDRVTVAWPAPRKGESEYVAVEDVSLEVGRGEFLSVVGPTGCGKSTLLNVAAGLLAPSAGIVRVAGEPLRGLNRRAGYLFQAEALLPWRSARENVAAGLQFRGIERRHALQRADEWLGRVGLAGFGDHYPHQLSGGMRRRVALAQTLILDPAIVLMDEPFSALDVQTRQLMENELLDLWSADRKSVVFITHDLEEAISLSDRVVVLSAGPATRAIGEFVIGLARPRDVAEVRLTRGFLELHREIWELLKAEVLKGHAQIQRA